MVSKAFRRDVATRAILITALLVPEIVLTRIAGDEETARTTLMLQAATQMIGLSVAAFMFFASARHEDHGRMHYRLPRLSLGVELPIVGFVMMALLAAVFGIQRHFLIGYVVGDTYKFLVIPLMFYVIFVGLRSRRAVDTAMQAVFALILVTEILYVAYYVLAGNKLHTRPMAVFLTTWLPSLLYCLYRNHAIRPRFAAMLAPVIAVIYAAITWYSQSLTLAGLTMILFCGTLLFHNRARFGILAFLALIVGILFASMLLLADIDLLSQTASAVTDPNFYLTRKFAFLFGGGLSVKTLELIGGDRIAQLYAVYQHWRSSTMDMVLGQGMGGEISVISVSGIFNKSWKTLNHFLEGGYPQVALRTGIIGLVCYMWFFAVLLKRAIAGSAKDPYLALAAAYLLYVSIFSIFNESLLGTGMGSLFMVCFLMAVAARRHAPDPQPVTVPSREPRRAPIPTLRTT